MLRKRLKRRGPSVFGYEPGWLWWAAVALMLIASAAVVRHDWLRSRRNDAYIEKRIEHHALEQGLDVALVAAVVEAESGGDCQAESNKQAKGLMQVTPIALEDVQRLEGIGGGDLFDVDYNLRVGTLYLSHLMDRFDDDVTLAVAAYHMGPTRVAKGRKKYPGLSSYDMVQKHGGPQTRAYVKKVLGLYEEALDK